MTTDQHNDIRTDIRLYIMELQRYLQAIQRDRTGNTDIAVDGVFGPNTDREVRQIQQEEGLPVDGVVDQNTWNAIVRLAEQAAQKNAVPLGLTVFRQGQPPLQEGDAGEDVFILQAVLRTLANHYRDLPRATEPTGRYDTATATLVKAIQQRSGLPETGRTDRLTWDAIARLYDERRYE